MPAGMIPETPARATVCAEGQVTEERRWGWQALYHLTAAQQGDLLVPQCAFISWQSPWHSSISPWTLSQLSFTGLPVGAPVYLTFQHLFRAKKHTTMKKWFLFPILPAEKELSNPRAPSVP